MRFICIGGPCDGQVIEYPTDSLRHGERIYVSKPPKFEISGLSGHEEVAVLTKHYEYQIGVFQDEFNNKIWLAHHASLAGVGVITYLVEKVYHAQS